MSGWWMGIEGGWLLVVSRFFRLSVTGSMNQYISRLLVCLFFAPNHHTNHSVLSSASYRSHGQLVDNH